MRSAQDQDQAQVAAPGQSLTHPRLQRSAQTHVLKHRFRLCIAEMEEGEIMSGLEYIAAIYRECKMNSEGLFVIFQTCKTSLSKYIYIYVCCGSKHTGPSMNLCKIRASWFTHSKIATSGLWSPELQCTWKIMILPSFWRLYHHVHAQVHCSDHLETPSSGFCSHNSKFVSDKACMLAQAIKKWSRRIIICWADHHRHHDEYSSGARELHGNGVARDSRAVSIASMKTVVVAIVSQYSRRESQPSGRFSRYRLSQSHWYASLAIGQLQLPCKQTKQRQDFYGWAWSWSS